MHAVVQIIPQALRNAQHVEIHHVLRLDRGISPRFIIAPAAEDLPRAIELLRPVGEVGLGHLRTVTGVVRAQAEHAASNVLASCGDDLLCNS